MNILENLFYTLDCMDAKDNPFETNEFQAAYDTFYNKYLASFDLDECNESCRALGDIVGITRQTAYEVGFKSAVQLILFGMTGLV